MDIVPLLPVLVRRAARLHMMGITTGFLTTLGFSFLSLLYDTIRSSKFCFSFAAVEKERLLGFVSFTENLGELYKDVIRKHPLRLLWILAGQFFSWKKLKGIVENLFYPGKVKKMELPTMALLAIVVDPEARGLGVGRRLIERGFQECRRRGIDRVRVLVGAENAAACALYERCGFEEAYSIINHGVPSKFYVADLTKIPAANPIKQGIAI
jgi:ribosomal protein S18 acetylase RimI-like enzyme